MTFSPNETSGVRDVDLYVQRQLGRVLLCTLDKRPPNHRLGQPHDILGREGQVELELPNERKQETFHPAG